MMLELAHDPDDKVLSERAALRSLALPFRRSRRDFLEIIG
jgi:hypothetical protein